MFSSFHPPNLIRAQRLLPEVPVAILALPGAGWWARSFLLRGISPEFVNPYFSDSAVVTSSASTNRAESERLDRQQSGGFEPPGKDGVDGLITDDPVAARRVVEVS